MATSAPTGGSSYSASKYKQTLSQQLEQLEEIMRRSTFYSEHTRTSPITALFTKGDGEAQTSGSKPISGQVVRWFTTASGMKIRTVEE